MKRWLIDMNIISEMMRRRPDARVEAWSIAEGDFHVCAITVEEITYGLERQSLKTKLKWFEAFLSNRCEILAVTESIATRAGSTRGQLASKGVTRAQPDMLIAATAWTHGLTLATRNTRDFEGTGIALFNPLEA